MKKILIYHFFILFAASLFSQNLQTNLRLYLPFSSNALDASGNGVNVTVYGATLTTDAHGNPNSAYAFDGISDLMTMSAQYPSLMQPSVPFSIVAWVKIPTNGANKSYIFQNNYIANDYYGALLMTMSTNIHLSIGNGGAIGPDSRHTKVSGTVSVFDNQWHLIVGVVRGYYDMDIYFDC